MGLTSADVSQIERSNRKKDRRKVMFTCDPLLREYLFVKLHKIDLRF